MSRSQKIFLFINIEIDCCLEMMFAWSITQSEKLEISFQNIGTHQISLTHQDFPVHVNFCSIRLWNCILYSMTSLFTPDIILASRSFCLFELFFERGHFPVSCGLANQSHDKGRLKVLTFSLNLTMGTKSCKLSESFRGHVTFSVGLLLSAEPTQRRKTCVLVKSWNETDVL